MVRAMVSETTSNSRFQRSRMSIQETGAGRLKTTSSTLSPSTKKSDRMCRLFPIICFTEVAESELRTQPGATAVSATGGVNTKPTCTRADAHFSRAHLTVHSSYSTAPFPMWEHRIGSRYKKNLCRAFLCAHFHLVCHVNVERSVCPFPSGPVLTYMLCAKNLSDLNIVWWQ